MINSHLAQPLKPRLGCRAWAIIHLALFPLLMTFPLQAGRIKTIDIFSMKRSVDGKPLWKGGHGSPAVTYDKQPSARISASSLHSDDQKHRAEAVPVDSRAGAHFSCLFSKKNLNRVYWDRRIALALQSYDILELDISCMQPDAVRMVGLYLKSGDGWYLWLNPLKQAGRQKLVFPVKNASTEGHPAGWNKISTVRLSFTKASDRNAAVAAYSLRARSCDIALVKGTVSVSDPDEKKAAQSVTIRLSRWLNDLAVAHAVIDDEDVIAGKLRTAHVAILPYNPSLPRKEMTALSAFVKRGGKLIVFYSAEPQLAQLLHMKLGNYKASKEPGYWSGFRFNSNAPAHVPVAVYQESHNIRPVYPAAPDARVIAYWNNAGGVVLRDPAWVQSDRGFWMSHILLDGDDKNKKSMMLSLLGFLIPAVWKEAAEHELLISGKVGPYESLQSAVSGIIQQCRGTSRKIVVKRLLSKAGQLRKKMHADWAQQKYPNVVETGRDLNAILIKAYGMAQRPRSPEFRGVWDHSGLGLYPGDWKKTCGILAGYGINAIFSNMLWPGSAHYQSDIVPQSYICRTYGDQLKACTAAARRYGLEIHVWKICWNLANAPAPWVKSLEKTGRLQQTDKGRTLKWLCPSNPDNVAMELNAILELVQQYQIQGIHLDYVRYPNAHACYCSGCRKRFEQRMGRKVSNWPESVKAGKLRTQYITWRCALISKFIRSVQKAVRQINPNVKISAAVYPQYPACINSVGQDWGQWLKTGIVDFVCPMDYMDDIGSFQSAVRKQLAMSGSKGKIFPGIGVTASESRLTPDRVIDQIKSARENSAQGFVLFDLNRTLEKEVLPILHLGVTRKEQ